MKFKSDIEVQAGLKDSSGSAGSSGQILTSTGTQTFWATTPITPGTGGSSQVFYFNGSVASSVAGYQQMSPTAYIGTGTDFSINANGYIASFLTDVNSPNQLNIPAGNWNFEIYMSASSGGGSPSFYVELYKYSSSTFTLIASSSATPEGITNGTAIDLYTTALAVPATALLVTDRLAVRVYVTNSSKTITMHTQDSHLCEVITTFSTGISALNGLTPSVQYFATNGSGTDFNIVSSGSTHTFNLPTASSTKRGALSSADWITFNSKQNALTNPITGTGTPNYVPKFTGTSALGNSSIYNAASGNIILGGTTDNGINKLQVNGSGYFQTGITIPDLQNANFGSVGSIYADPEFNEFYISGYNTLLYGSLSSLLRTVDSFAGLYGDNFDVNSNGGSFNVNSYGPNSYNVLNIETNAGLATFQFDVAVVGSITAGSIIKSGGTSSQFLKANGSVDSNTYLTTSAASTTYAPISGSANYIQASPTSAQSANMWISGSGTFGSNVLSSGFFYTPSNATSGALSGYITQYNSNSGSRSWKITNDVIAFGDFSIGQSTTQTGNAYTDRIYINPLGNVGIGTTSVLDKLSVFGGNFRLSNSGTYDMIFQYDYDGGSSDSFKLNRVNHNTQSTGITKLLEITNAGAATFASSVTANGNCVINGTSGDDTLYLQKSTGASLSLSGSTGTTNKVIIAGSNTTNPDLFVYTGGSERMRITSGGNVLIGTTTDNGVDKLQVNGSVSATSFSGSGAGLTGVILNQNASAQSANMWISGSAIVNSSEIRPLLSTGTSVFKLGTYAANGLYGSFVKTNHNYSSDLNTNLILGVSNAGTPLDALTLASTGAATFASSVTTGGDIRVLAGSAVNFNRPDNGAASSILMNSSNQLVFTSPSGATFSGFVGIGTTSPGEKLSIAGNVIIQNGNSLKFGEVSSTNAANGINQTNGTGITIGVYKSGSTGVLGSDSVNALTIQEGTGNVGIGTTTPDSKLHVAGNIKVGNSLDNSSQWIGKSNSGAETFRGAIKFTSTTTDDILQFNTHRSGVSSDIRMTIDGIGNVGIGTTSPSVKLQINQTTSGVTNNFTQLITSSDGGKGMFQGIDITNRKFYWRVNDSDDYGYAFQNAAGSNLFSIVNSGAATFSSSVTLGNSLYGYTGGLSAYKTYSKNAQFEISSYQSAGGSPYTKTLDIVSNADSGVASNMRFLTTTSAGTPSTAMFINESGNVGIGVTPNASWATGFKAIQMTSGASLLSHPSVPITYLSSNYLATDAGSKYISSDFASRMLVNGYQGGFQWDIAPSGTAGGAISFTTAMMINSSGNVLIGTTTDNGVDKLQVNGSAKISVTLASSSSPTLMLTQGGTYANIAGVGDSFHGIILRGIPTNYWDYSVTAGNYMSFYEYGGDFRFYKKDVYSLVQLATITSAGITATGFFNSSDSRLKDIISQDGDTVEFTWKDKRDDKKHIGYIAQEVQKTYPDQVSEGSDGMLSVNYIEILVAKIQALENRIKQLEK